MNDPGSRLHAQFAGGLLAVLLGFALTQSAVAAVGDCGQPKSGGAEPTASDALETLRTAVGLSSCGGFDFCICDVDSAGGVVAGDALRVLRKAVGQDVTLTCPCIVTTTTSSTTTTLHEVLTTELLLLTKMQGTYATSELAGTWEGAALVSGPAAPLWFRGTLSVQSNGSFTGETTASNGAMEDIDGKLALASSGILTCTDNCLPDFRGAVDSGKTLAAITDTLEESSSELFVVTRRAASCVQSDLAGTWAMHALETGPGAPLWSRATLEVQDNGAFDGGVVNSEGEDADVSGTMTLSGTGRITCASSLCTASFLGALDSGKTLGVATQTAAGGSTDMMILSKRAATYSQSDLAGTWYASSLASGQDEPFWSRGTLTIGAGGAVSGTLTANDGSMRSPGGTLSVSSDGVVTKSNDPDFRCALDAGKSVLVCTDSW